MWYLRATARALPTNTNEPGPGIGSTPSKAAAKAQKDAGAILFLCPHCMGPTHNVFRFLCRQDTLLVSHGVGLHCVQPEPYWRMRYLLPYLLKY